MIALILTMFFSSPHLHAAPMEVICKKLGINTTQTMMYSKVSLPNGSGGSAVFYAPTSAVEIRGFKPSHNPAGAQGQNLKDGECAFRDIGISPSFTQGKIEISGASQIAQTVQKNAGTTAVNNAFNRFGGLCCNTSQFKVELESKGNSLTLKADGGVIPTQLP